MYVKKVPLGTVVSAACTQPTHQCIDHSAGLCESRMHVRVHGCVDSSAKEAFKVLSLEILNIPGTYMYMIYV